jgi:hypothetical protein
MREINFQEATNDWKAWVEECLREIERASRDSSTNTFIDQLLAAPDDATARTILQVPPPPSYSAFINTLLAATNAATARTTLGATTIGSALFTAASASAALALLIPSGTPMLFQQTAAPTGWTKQTTHNDKALRVVSGAASSGGVFAFSTVFAKTATDATTLLVSQIPSHQHFGSGLQNATDSSPVGSDGSPPFLVTGTTGLAESNYAGQFTGGSGSHTHPMDIRVQFVDLIIATKD